jgi:hypothetical protein
MRAEVGESRTESFLQAAERPRPETERCNQCRELFSRGKGDTAVGTVFLVQERVEKVTRRSRQTIYQLLPRQTTIEHESTKQHNLHCTAQHRLRSILVLEHCTEHSQKHNQDLHKSRM